jgi:hypothetical protein
VFANSSIRRSGYVRKPTAVLDCAFNKKVTTRNWRTIEGCYQAMQAGVDG